MKNKCIVYSKGIEYTASNTRSAYSNVLHIILGKTILDNYGNTKVISYINNNKLTFDIYSTYTNTKTADISYSFRRNGI